MRSLHICRFVQRRVATQSPGYASPTFQLLFTLGAFVAWRPLCISTLILKTVQGVMSKLPRKNVETFVHLLHDPVISPWCGVKGFMHKSRYGNRPTCHHHAHSPPQRSTTRSLEGLAASERGSNICPARQGVRQTSTDILDGRQELVVFVCALWLVLDAFGQTIDAKSKKKCTIF